MPIASLRKTATTILFTSALAAGGRADTVDVGPRPHFLVQQMQDGPLKQAHQACSESPSAPSLFSIGHRGFPARPPIPPQKPP